MSTTATAPTCRLCGYPVSPRATGGVHAACVAVRPAAATTDGATVWLTRNDGSDVVLTECRWYFGDAPELDAFESDDDVVLTRAEERAVSRAYLDYADECRIDAVCP